MPPTLTSDELVTIGGVPLAIDGAWRCLNPSELWQGGDVRGSDRPIPGAAGVLPKPRRHTVTARLLKLVVYGETDHNGDPHADPRAGVWANLAYLRANVADPVATGDGTRTCTVLLPDGATMLTGNVTPEGMEFVPWEAAPVVYRATVRLSVPAGVLATAAAP